MEMEIKNNVNYPMYEFNSIGQYRRKGATVWSLGKITNSGLYKAILKNTETKKTMFVHEVIYETFFEPLNENEGVKHKNEVLTDNSIENLEKYELGVKKSRKEIMKDLRKNTYTQQKRICARNIKTGEKLYFKSKSACAKYYGCSPATVYMVCENKMKIYNDNIIFFYDLTDKPLTEVVRKKKENCLSEDEKKKRNRESMIRYLQKKLVETPVSESTPEKQKIYKNSDIGMSIPITI